MQLCTTIYTNHQTIGVTNLQIYHNHTHADYTNLIGIYTVEPRYKEVGYNETLLLQGNFAGSSSLYFFIFYPDIMRNLI